MASAHTHKSTPGDRKYLDGKVGSLRTNGKYEQRSGIDEHFEVASHPAPDFMNGIPVSPDRQVFARATLIGREGYSAMLDYLYVEVGQRGNGNGRELLRLVDEFAIAKNLRTIYAPTATDECSELYEHCGYVQDGEGRKNGRIREDGFEHENRTYRKDFF